MQRAAAKQRRRLQEVQGPVQRQGNQDLAGVKRIDYDNMESDQGAWHAIAMLMLVCAACRLVAVGRLVAVTTVVFDSLELLGGSPDTSEWLEPYGFQPYMQVICCI